MHGTTGLTGLRSAISNWLMVLYTITCAVILSGCASPGDGFTAVSSLKQFASPPAPKPPMATPVIGLEYVARVEPRALPEFQRVMSLLWHPGSVGEVMQEDQSAKLADTLAKTVFYVVEAKRAFEEQFGSGSVVLLPLTVDLSDQGAVMLRESNRSTVVPAQVFFSVRRKTAFQRRALDWEIYDTTGWMLHPQFALFVNSPRLADDLKLKTSYEGLGGLAVGRWLNVQATTRWNDAFKGYASIDPTLANGWSPMNPVEKPSAGANDILTIAGGGFRFAATTAAMSQFAQTGETPFMPGWRSRASNIAEMLRFWLPEAETEVLVRAAEDYDHSLAWAIRSGQGDAAKIELIREFLAAEASLLREADDRFVEDVYYGDFGKSMRQILVAQSRMLDELAATNNRAITKAVLSVGMTAAMSYQPGTTGMSFSQAIGFQTQLLATMASAASDASAEGQALGSMMDRHFTSTLDGFRDFVIKAGDREITVRADSLAGLRQELKKVWASVYGG